MKLLAFGEILWDIYPNEKFMGGAPFNFAAHFSKCGGSSWISTAVGKDKLGCELIKRVEESGVSTDCISVLSDKITGQCIVSQNQDFIPTYNLLDNVAYDFIEYKNPLNENFDILYFGTLALRHQNNRDVLRRIITDNRFKEIFADVNIRPPYYSKEVLFFVLSNASILKISEEELPILTEALGFKDDIAKEIKSNFKNVKLLIITKGGDGAEAYDLVTSEKYSCDAEKVNVVSTVGAGDSFSAAFSSEYLKTGNIENCLKFASRISGFVVSRFDSVPDYSADDFK